MSISLDEVNRIAKLARINFSDEEKQKFPSELSAILDYVGQLKKLEDQTLPTVEDPDAVNRMRTDVAEGQADPEIFLNQAPNRQGKFIKVTRVLE